MSPTRTATSSSSGRGRDEPAGAGACALASIPAVHDLPAASAAPEQLVLESSQQEEADACGDDVAGLYFGDLRIGDLEPLPIPSAVASREGVSSRLPEKAVAFRGEADSVRIAAQAEASVAAGSSPVRVGDQPPRPTAISRLEDRLSLISGARLAGAEGPTSSKRDERKACTLLSQTGSAQAPPSAPAIERSHQRAHLFGARSRADGETDPLADERGGEQMLRPESPCQTAVARVHESCRAGRGHAGRAALERFDGGPRVGRPANNGHRSDSRAPPGGLPRAAAVVRDGNRTLAEIASSRARAPVDQRCNAVLSVPESNRIRKRGSRRCRVGSGSGSAEDDHSRQREVAHRAEYEA